MLVSVSLPKKETLMGAVTNQEKCWKGGFMT